MVDHDLVYPDCAKETGATQRQFSRAVGGDVHFIIGTGFKDHILAERLAGREGDFDYFTAVARRQEACKAQIIAKWFCRCRADETRDQYQT